MKLLHRDLKHGVVKLQVENLDDLWHLSRIIREGDLVRGKTERRIRAKEDISRGKSERKTIGIELRVGSFAYKGGIFRITGIIEQGPEDLIPMGSHHTLQVEENSVIKITKSRWLSSDLDRLKEAQKSAIRPKLLIAGIDEGEANLALVRESKIEYFDLSGSIGGKYDTSGRKERKAEFYKEVMKFISETIGRENISAVIISGTGFEPENLHRFIIENKPELKEKLFLEKTSSSGRRAIQEVMKRDLVKRIGREVSSAMDVQMIDKLLVEIGKDSGLGVYGMKEIENAAGSGAIELLLIADDLFVRERESIEKIIDLVKKTRGKVHLLNHEAEAGEQLNSLGGIGAILRFKIG